MSASEVPAGTVHPAGMTACQACPWRTANHGQRNAGGWYTKANLRRLWAKLRQGDSMSCHPTDPRMNDDPGMPRPVPEGTVLRECAGSLVLIEREANRFEEIVKAGGSLADYRRAHPMGLTRDGILSIVGRSFSAVPIIGDGRPKMTAVDVDDPAVGYERLVPWEPKTD